MAARPMVDDEDDQSAESHVTAETEKRASGIFQRIRKRVNTLSHLRPLGQFVVIAIACLVLAFALLWLLDKIFYYYLARTYVDQIAQTFDLNQHLANALVLATFFMAAIFGRLIWSLSKTTRRIGIAGFAVLLIGHSILLWYGTRGELIDRAGNTIKCYVLSRDGNVTYGEHPGIDPATGRECRPVKPELVERLQEYATGKRAQKIDDPNPAFFDPRSGEPIVWYYKSKTGVIELYDLMGFEPNMGEELLPVTKQIAQEWKNQSRRGPRLINSPEKYLFFDPVSGNAQAWYWRDADGSYEFYDAPGFQPQTGEKLNVVTRDVVDDWKKHVTPTHVPRRVDPTKYPFFDLTTGVAQVWYWRAKDGSYEFYDAPGFEPQTGEKLSVVTREVVSKWKDSLVPPVSPAQSSAPAAGTSPANHAVASSGNLGIELRQKTAIFLVNLYAGASGPNSEYLKEASRYYAEQVAYFGKPYTREQILLELQRSNERWPIRSYRMRTESLVIDCDEGAMSCTASGLLDFDCKSPERRQRSSGAATFGYLLKYSSPKEPPVIIEESGEVKARRIEPLAFNANPQQEVEGQLPDQQAILRAILNGMLGQAGH